jgi:hypothetical protein
LQRVHHGVPDQAIVAPHRLDGAAFYLTIITMPA